LFTVNSRWTVDGKNTENLSRYVNHSCYPNCEAEIRGKKILISSIRNIKAGDELAYNYGKEYFDEFIKPHGCRCEKCIR
jgi:SET domain-containing protein